MYHSARLRFFKCKFCSSFT